MSVRAIFLIFVTLVQAFGAGPVPLAGKWAGQAPNPIGKTEDVELTFTADASGLTGILHTPDRDFKLAKVRLQGRSLTFDVTRDLRGRGILYHYNGTLSGDSLDFTAQNDDGSSFYRFTVRREQ